MRLSFKLDIKTAIYWLVTVLEISWAYAWLTWVSTWPAFRLPAPPLGFLSAFVLSIAAGEATRRFLATNLPARKAGLLVLAVVVPLVIAAAVLGTGFPPPGKDYISYLSERGGLLAAALVFGVYFSWRGISVGRSRLAFGEVYNRFAVGLVLLVVLFILDGLFWAATGSLLTGWVSPYVIAFFTLGLASLALTGFWAARERSLPAGGSGISLSRRWLGFLAVAILAVILLSLSFSSLFSGELLSLVMAGIQRIGDLLFAAFMYGIVLPLAVLMSFLWRVVDYLIVFFRLRQPPANPEGEADFNIWDLAERITPFQFPPALLAALKWLLVLSVITLACYLLYRSVFRYFRPKGEEGVEETQESILSWQALKNELGQLAAELRDRLRNLRREPAQPEPLPAAVAGLSGGVLFTVRQIYEGLLWLGQNRGYGRLSWQTPYDYQRILKANLSENEGAVEAITASFVSDFYGSSAPGSEELDNLNRLWASLFPKPEPTE